MLTEKYRPKDFNSFIGNADIVREIISIVNSRDMPHLMFVGKAGVGKTTMAQIIIDMLYGGDKSRKYLEINASDDNSINTIRGEIKDYARTSGSSKSFNHTDVPYRIIILDEADYMTQNALAALKRIMEQFSKYCRFILICNNEAKIIAPIKSRCSIFRFKPIKPEEMKDRLKIICNGEGMVINEEALDFVTRTSDGDIRYAINTFIEKAKSRGLATITMNDIEQIESIDTICVGVIKDALNGRFNKARNALSIYVNENSTEMGKVFQKFSEIATTMRTSSGATYPEEMIAKICKICLKCEYYATQGVGMYTLIGGFVANLFDAKEKFKPK